MKIKSLVVATLVLCAASSLTGCAICPGVDPKSVEAAGTIRPADPGYYAVENHDGRIYVFGDKKTHDAWQKSHDIQIRRTYIGAGPAGETIMFEARDKVPEMTKRIVGRYSAETGLRLDP